MSYIDCYTNIIGLSRNPCSCYGPLQASTTVSTSGVYLDELDGLNLSVLDSLNDCEEGNLFAILDDSRQEAIEIFKSEILAAVANRARLTRNPFKGYIGDTNKTRTLTLSGAMAYLRIYCCNIRGGVFRPKRIGLIFNQVSTFDIGLYDNVSDTVLYVWTVTTVAGKLTWFTIPDDVELPMSNYACKNYQYFFVFPVHFNMPKDNPIHCGCGNQPVWDLDQPDFTPNTKYAWTQWVMATGGTGSDITEREEWTNTRHANGLVIDAEFTCKIKDLLCGDEMDFEGDPLAMKVALTVRYKAGELALKKVLSSTNLNRYTMIDRELLTSNAGVFVEEFKEAVMSLADEIAKPNNINKYTDCFACTPAHGFKRGRILI